MYIGFFVYQYNPNYAFDESNTIRISSQSFYNILEILRYEQNFPLYYFISHIFLSIYQKSQILQLFQFITWIFSIIFFYKLSKYFFKTKSESLFVTFIYTILPASYFYAFYIRMYGLLNLFGIVFLLFLTKFVKYQSTKSLYMAFFCLLIMVLLHPSGILFLPLALPLLLFAKPRQRLSVILFGTMILVIFLFQISLKVDLLKSYLGVGVNANNDIYPIYSRFIIYSSVVFQNIPTIKNFLDVSFSIVFFIVLFYRFIDFKKFKNTDLVLVISLFEVMLISFAILNITATRHMVIFAVPIVIFLFQSIMVKITTIKVVSAYLLLTLIIAQNLVYMTIIKEDFSFSKSFCKNIMMVESNSLVITSMTVYNAVSFCNPDLNNIVFASTMEPFYIKNKSTKDVLIEQAKLGGFGERLDYPINIVSQQSPQNLYLAFHYWPDPEYYKVVRKLVPKNYRYIETIYPSIDHFEKTSNQPNTNLQNKEK